MLGNKGTVISLYDFTGEALRPWAKAGYTCYAFDIQHPKETGTTFTSDRREYFTSQDPTIDGIIRYTHADLHDRRTLEKLCDSFNDGSVVFGMAFPVCTDMAVSGAAHFKRKAEVDPDFQTKAVEYAKWCGEFFDDLEVPYFIENPVSVLATQWRKPDYNFHPYEYGGYINYDDAKHPRWPEYIAPFDAYPKKTCLWTGGDFNMPTKVAVDVPAGYSTQHTKLGGKSQRTKDIRSATPRGFAKAVYEANKKDKTNA